MKIERPVNSYRTISKISTTPCWVCKSKEEQYTLMKASFKDLRKKDGSIRDFAGFLSMLLGILGTSLFGNLLARKGVILAGEGATRACQDF